MQNVRIVKKSRGRKPKREIVKYALLIAIKELKKKNLREAETDLSDLICNERVDHSVIAYWENKPNMALLVSKLISIAGARLNEVLASQFTFVDATKFTNWTVDEIFVTVCNHVAYKTVYPVGISFRKGSVLAPVDESVPKGEGKLLADAGYDDNRAIRNMFEKGYTPIVCPNKNRIRGYYRRKARKLYRLPENRLGYRQRGRGESMFGSLTNCFGDRFKAKNLYAMQTRIATRILCYQIKLLIRINYQRMSYLLDTL
jgi:hypothetical protein